MEPRSRTLDSETHGSPSSLAEESEYRLTSGMRLLLALTALVITRIDPSEPSRLVGPTYALLAVYATYAGLLYVGALKGMHPKSALVSLLPWVDVGAYVTLVGLSGGSNSIYFTLFFFGILVASFRGGFQAGIAVTTVSVALFALVGYLTRPAGPGFDLNRFLLRSSALPVLGYMIANRGGYEVRLRRRLALLREIATLSNPRFGGSRTFAMALERLRAFYDADVCLAVLWPPQGAPGELRRAARGKPDAALVVEPIPAALRTVLSPFEESAAVYYHPSTRWRAARTVTQGPSWPRRQPPPVTEDECREIAEWLGAPAFLTVPLRAGRRPAGRLYLAAHRPHFDASDAEFVGQAVSQIMPTVEHVDLVERMATRAAEDERQRIALDIHDRVIQPYVGLQIGLTALHQLATARSDAQVLPLLRERTEKLLSLSAQGTSDLRAYIQGLRQGGATGRQLPDSLRRFADRFQDATGIEVAVLVPEHVHVHDHLAEEVFSMATEAVSNVRRHTNAPRASIELQDHSDRLVLRVSNPTEPTAPPGSFTPRSIVERAAAVGGTVRVDTGVSEVAVVVEIPL